MIKSKLSEQKIILTAAAAGFLALFIASGYFLSQSISAAEMRYRTLWSELRELELKQQQLSMLQEELAKTKNDRAVIENSLLSSSYEDQLAFIIDLETLAKNSGLTYEFRIAGEVTEESIRRERDSLARARRQAGEARQLSVEEKFPSIALTGSFKGEFANFVKYLEGLHSLPYFIRIKNLNISQSKIALEGAGGPLELFMEFEAFTR